MNSLHPLTALVLGVLAVGGRVLLDLQLGVEAGEVWQRGIEALSGAVVVMVALQFSAGIFPRRPWALLGVAMAVVPLIFRLVSHLGLAFGDIKVAHLLLIGGNIFMAASLIGFGRVLGSSELLSERTAEDRLRATAFVGLLAVSALAVIGYNTIELAGRGPPVGAGAWVATIATTVSTLSDALVFAGGLYLLWLLRPPIGGSLALA